MKTDPTIESINILLDYFTSKLEDVKKNFQEVQELNKQMIKQLQEVIVHDGRCPECFEKLTTQCFPDGADDYYKAFWCSKCKRKYE